MPWLSTSDLQLLPLVLHPHLLSPPSRPNFHHFQPVPSRREGKQGSRGRVKTPDREVPEAEETEAEDVAWELTKWLEGWFDCGG